MKNKTMFLEFNGIPGSGKTTLSNRVIKDMKSKNYPIESYHKVIKKPTRKKLKDLLLYLLRIKLGSVKIGYLATMYLITNKKLNHENWLRVFSLVVLFDFYQKKGQDRGDEVILVDQGIVQQIISMLYESELIADKYVKRIICLAKKKNLGIYVVNVDLDINTSFERLVKRRGNISRIQKLNKADAIHTLTIQQNNFNKIREILNELEQESIDVNSKACIDETVQSIVNYIMRIQDR
ncbi:AAA family ATPase [Acetobacterium wieringae]|uniref:AAA family ATPase n=1 Tax=Acetobacterium wieringae TaxID=52694 RepID=UPI0026EE5324|nr:AAA family ATPase [Acetobacterium wieringae]